ncbi:hypothetical protein LOTGIDRAFT_169056 [Lottia gigantea]|uniref:Uncharacterized protein n=1 Tax=Lottia gigantea TaxID=225164 RepID=V3ZSE0_LOTGI|nr:hypothetical protein LOTGIDRAFT_169056 [Lottia gigantea]ESO83821.1 hypothetical protein LOTGIDRAFT_169056 [Lottia gigantea]
MANLVVCCQKEDGCFRTSDRLKMKNTIITMVSSLHFLVFVVSAIESKTQPETSTELDLCKANSDVNSVCQACSKLPYGMSMSVESCCHDYQILTMCDSCTSDPVRCMKDVLDLETNIVEQKTNPEVSNEDTDDVDDDESLEVKKRYGRMFFGRRPILYSNYLNKRFGRLFFGGRRQLFTPIKTYKQKRYGRLFMNKKSEGSNGAIEEVPDKRYGRLFMTPYLDKRYGAFRIGKPSSARYFWK